MRIKILAFVTCAALPLLTSPAVAAEPAPELLAYPGVVALSESAPGEWSYKKFPGLARLYVSDRDTESQSNCYDNCVLAWPPVYASENAEPIGQWTIIERNDGTRQWAYKNQPVYERYHDSPTNPSGDGVDGFSFLEM